MREAIAEKPAVEQLDGRRYPKVSPRLEHMVVQGNLCAIVRRCAGDRGLSGPELHVYPGRVDRTQTIFVPDVAFVSWERLDALGAERQQPRSPDVAIEVRSPSNDLGYLQQKIARYLTTGSLLVLDVDPKERTIVAYDANGSECFKSNARFERAAVPWLAFDVSEVFANLDRTSGG